MPEVFLPFGSTATAAGALDDAVSEGDCSRIVSSGGSVNPAAVSDSTGGAVSLASDDSLIPELTAAVALDAGAGAVVFGGAGADGAGGDGAGGGGELAGLGVGDGLGATVLDGAGDGDGAGVEAGGDVAGGGGAVVDSTGGGVVDST
ncbi:MAG: hypothetical protein ABIM89_15590, partial [Mycobacteriales bacterium]